MWEFTKLVLAAGLALLGDHLVAPFFTTTRERRWLLRAFAAEIEGLVSITERRRYLQMLREERKAADRVLEANRETSSVPPERISSAPIHFSYFDVYEANVSKLGLLGDLAPDVVSFYIRSKSFLEDMRELRRLASGDQPVEAFLLREMTGELGNLLEELQGHGRKLVVQLRDEATAPPWSPFSRRR